MSTAHDPAITHDAPGALAEARGDWAGFGLEDDIRPALAEARAAGEPCALVTLHDAQGGAPRGVGAQMLVRRGSVHGFLSGGCIEADVTLHALQVLEDGFPRRLVYGEGGPIDIRLPCGGRVDLLIERLAPDDQAAGVLLEAWAARQPAVWISDGVARSCAVCTDGVLPAQGMDSPGTIRRTYVPQPRLAVFGRDPIVLALCTMAAQSGIETWLVRAKGPDTPPPVPGVHYLRGSPDEDIARIAPDRWTAIVAASHDDFDDRAVLTAALPSAAGYVGLLGARRHLPRKLDQLRRKGLAEDQITRLRAPVGLPLGGRAPWQIAVSIFAEFTQWAASQCKAFDDATGAPSVQGQSARSL